MSTRFDAVIPAPFGAIGLCVADGYLTGLEFLAHGASLVQQEDEAVQAVCHSISGYLNNPETPLNLPLKFEGTVFQKRVWEALRRIPLGATWTYTELAEQTGSGPRAVANACGANPIALVIPCHRVVAKNGLGGFMKGRGEDTLNIKRWLLEHERRKPVAAG